MRRKLILMFGIVAVCVLSSCQSRQANPRPFFRGPCNAVYINAQSFVLIVPTNESDEAAQRQIHDRARMKQELLVRKWPSIRIKAMTDRDALSKDLADSSLVIYGTPQGNLWLAKHVAELPVVIKPNRIATDRLHEGTDLSVITAWPNPQNPERGMIVYTAQKAQHVVNIERVTHGATDYVVARGQTILQAGNYNIKTNHWSFRLSLGQAVEDLDYFFKTFEKVHFNHLANLSKKDYQLLKDHSRTTLEQAYARTGHISKPTLALTVAEAAAALGDGHTYCPLASDLVDPYNDFPCLPPFRMGWQAGHIVISETCEDLRHIKGAQLLRINDQPLGDVLAPIVAKISGEKWSARIASFLYEQDLYWALIRPVDGRAMTITLRQATGGPQVLTVEPISPSQYRRQVPPGPRPPPLGFHRFYHNDRTCYWQYNSCDPTAQGREFTETVFRSARERNARNLIIDLRFNPGGSDYAVQAIIDHLTSRPYRVYSRIGGKISEHLLQQTPQWYLRPLKGLSIAAPIGAKRPKDVQNRFEGSVYAITSPYTFSAAADFASVLKDYGIATLVGDETGGNRQTFGEACGDRMPNSGVEFRVSCKLFYAPVPKPDDARRGTVPDVAFTDELLAPFMSDNDPGLAFTLDLVQERDRCM